MQDEQYNDGSQSEWAREWSLSANDSNFIEMQTSASRFDYGLKIAFYRLEGRFPRATDEIPTQVMGYIADQVGSSSAVRTKSKTRTEQRRKEKILQYLSIGKFTEETRPALNAYLEAEPRFATLNLSSLTNFILLWCLEHSVAAPSKREITRTHHALSERFANAEFERIFSAIPSADRVRMIASLAGEGGSASFSTIRREVTGSGRDAFYQIASRLRYIESLALPHTYFDELDQDFLLSQDRKVRRFEPREIRRFSDKRKVAMYAIYLHRSRLTFTDKLISIMLDAINSVYERSKREAIAEAGKKRQDTFNTTKLLSQILMAYEATPQRSVKSVVEGIMAPNDVREWLDRSKSIKSPAAATFEFMRSRWKSYYRPMLRVLLETLEFHTNIASQTPLIKALDWIHLNFDGRRPIYIDKDQIPIEGVLTDKERKAVVDAEGRVDRYHYELCVAKTLRTALKGRALWVENSGENGNPDLELPQDFDENCETYYADLNLSQDGNEFIEAVRSELETQLRGLNAEIISNPSVNVQWTSNPRFMIKPFPAAKEPPGISKIKAALVGTWPKTSLLDMLKETALDTGFIREFKTIGDRLNLEHSTVFERLLLTIYGTGTNAGLKAMAGAVPGVTYNHLQHIQRRLMSVDNLKRANIRVSNAILGIRDPRYWGEQGTACASDSKQYPAWDNNLGTEYHARYRGNGIMIYWHVDGKSMCVYSSLKSVQSSEVASMIEGVIRHCTDMKIDTQHTDSHGQTEVAFAFSHLLGFQLAPRIKGVGKTKLYLPNAAMRSELGEIGTMLKLRPIDWGLITPEFHEMVRYTSALKNRNNSPDTILRKFTRSGVKHPTYRALQELGRALKTIFVCRYLRSEKLRREINESLNVMENWNGATRFVLFGKSGEFTSRRDEDREMTVQALHLLQNSMVYVNTQMYQSVLRDTKLADTLTSEDIRALTPLIHAHVNPFGHYVLEMNQRIPGLSP